MRPSRRSSSRPATSARRESLSSASSRPATGPSGVAKANGSSCSVTGSSAVRTRGLSVTPSPRASSRRRRDASFAEAVSSAGGRSSKAGSAARRSLTVRSKVALGLPTGPRICSCALALPFKAGAPKWASSARDSPCSAASRVISLAMVASAVIRAPASWRSRPDRRSVSPTVISVVPASRRGLPATRPLSCSSLTWMAWPSAIWARASTSNGSTISPSTVVRTLSCSCVPATFSARSARCRSFWWKSRALALPSIAGLPRASVTLAFASRRLRRPKSPTRSRTARESSTACPAASGRSLASRSTAPRSGTGSKGASPARSCTLPLRVPSIRVRSRSIASVPSMRERGAFSASSFSARV